MVPLLALRASRPSPMAETKGVSKGISIGSAAGAAEGTDNHNHTSHSQAKAGALGLPFAKPREQPGAPRMIHLGLLSQGLQDCVVWSIRRSRQAKVAPLAARQATPSHSKGFVLTHSKETTFRSSSTKRQPFRSLSPCPIRGGRKALA